MKNFNQNNWVSEMEQATPCIVGRVCTREARSVPVWAQLLTGNYITHWSRHMVYGNNTDVNMIGGEYRTHKRHQKCIHNFTRITLMLRDHVGGEGYLTMPFPLINTIFNFPLLLNAPGGRDTMATVQASLPPPFLARALSGFQKLPVILTTTPV